MQRDDKIVHIFFSSSNSMPPDIRYNSKFITMRRIVFLLLVLFLSLATNTTGDSRSNTILIQCGKQQEHNTSAYVPNFVKTMENISDQIQTAHYASSVVGSGPDGCHGLAQCYGDLSQVDCVFCYAEARTKLPQCFPYNGGRIYLDGCFMRAENYSFYEEFVGPNDTVKCGNVTKKSEQFVNSARQAMSDAASAAFGKEGYARADVPVAGSMNESAYVLANCWETLNSSLCKACLENALASITKCLPWSEGRAMNTGCFLRYSDTDFLNPAPSSGLSKERIIVMVLAIVSSVAVAVVGIAIGVYIWKRRRIQKKRKGAYDAVKMASLLSDSRLNFKYSTLEKATGSFDFANKLGQGGFGTVYKGVLADGREVAVKRLFFNNKHRAAGFYNEVNIINSVQHKNLVRLLGCSCTGPESLLVYEFVQNRSLDRFIFDADKGKALNWKTRFEIVIGTVEGLVYLHENSGKKIIHRDIKASNILLDFKLRAKIADFGLARSFQDDKSHISTAIAGTLGYMAPEYLAHGQLTEKADVYSFGVLSIEIVCGKQNNRSKICDDSDSLVISAWKHFQAGTMDELIDPNLMLQNYQNKEELKSQILRVVHVGLLCIQEIPSLRPTMSRVLQMLLKTEDELPNPTNPPFIDERTMELNDTCENPDHPLNSNYSVASISHSSFYPR